MRVLLINPYIIPNTLFYGFMKKIGSNLPPLGLAYLASYLEENNHIVKIIDNKIEKYDLKTLLRIIDKFEPDIIGINSITTHLLHTIYTAKFLKKNLKNIKIVVGGPHASAKPIELLNFCKEIDYIIVGEGEIGLNCLLNNLSHPDRIKNIPGLVFRNKRGLIFKNNPILIKDINILPFPARHLLPMEKYRPSIINYKNLPSRSLITTRGCPYNCSYCFKISKIIRSNNPKKIINEILILENQYNAKELIFWDDCFTFNKIRLLKLFQLMKKNNVDLPWMAMSRIDNVSKKFLLELKKNNCWRLGFGIESGSPYVLRKLNKKINLRKAKEIIQFCRKIGIETKIFMMIGNAYDNYKTIKQTIHIAKKLNPDIVQYSYFVPFPQTKDFHYIIEHFNNFDPQYYFKRVYPDYHNLNKPIFIPSDISERKLKILHSYAYINFYFRFNYIKNRFKKINSFSELYKNFIISTDLLKEILFKIKL
ncbi:MAG: B12-binding domain-containing radical SAM protein [Promethearchaeota archaeon]